MVAMGPLLVIFASKCGLEIVDCACAICWQCPSVSLTPHQCVRVQHISCPSCNFKPPLVILLREKCIGVINTLAKL